MSSASAGAVLEETDRTFIVALPVLLVCIAISIPNHAFAGVLSALLGGALAGILWISRNPAAYPRRGLAYTVIALVVATSGLWFLGPYVGIGVAFGLAVLFAGAFLSRRAVIIVLSISIVTIGARTLTHPTEPRVLEVNASLWIALAIACGVMLWIATRVMTALVKSLETSYARAARSYQQETDARAQLDRTRQELEELEQVELVGRLAAGVAHDVNNALAGILAATDVMAEEVSTPEQRRHLAELEAASYHAADLVRDLTWIGRKFPASSVAVAELGVTMRACKERLERVARTLSLETAIESSAWIAMPPEHLEQVLFALIVGAHRTGASRLVIESASEQDTLSLTLRGAAATDVSDHGPRAIRAHLRLLAAKELVTQYGGMLTSTVVDGTLVAELRVRRAPTAQRIGSQPIARQFSALVVDDEPMILRRLCQLVARRGYTVTPASTLAEGLALLEQRPSLVVTDIQLPDGSGEAIAAASFAADPRRPIVVCSGYGADEMLQSRLRSARISFLQKPFTVEQLECVIPLVNADRVA